MFHSSNHQRGSAILYIFIGIALFGALMFMFSRGASQNSQGLSKQQAVIYASEIIEYGNKVEKAVQKLLMNGCSETEISFENSYIAGYDNSNSPTDKRCHVFDSNGGNVHYLNPDVKWGIGSTLTYLFSTLHCINNVGTTNNCSSSNNSELRMDVLFLNKDVCLEINKKLGIDVSSGDAPSENHSVNIAVGNFFTGTFTNLAGSTGILSGTSIDGKSSACIKDSVGSYAGKYIYYQVLIAR